MPKKPSYTLDMDRSISIDLRNKTGRVLATVTGHPATLVGLLGVVVHHANLGKAPRLWSVSDPATGGRCTSFEGKDPEKLLGQVAARLTKGAWTKAQIQDRQLRRIDRFTTF